MKKIIAFIIAVFAVSALFAACGNNNENWVIDKEELTGRLLDELEFEDEMVEIEFDVIDKFYVIDKDILASCKAYKSSSGSTAEEIAVFEAKNIDDVDAIKTSVSKRVEDLKSSFEDYIPKELDKINSAKAAVVGRYVILYIVNDVEAAKAIVANYLP